MATRGTCKKCEEPEDHMNHYADYTLDGEAWHNKDHDFEPAFRPHPRPREGREIEMEIFDFCPNCHRATGIEDHADDPEIERDMVICTHCGWEGYDSWLVREDGTNEDDTGEATDARG